MSSVSHESELEPMALKRRLQTYYITAVLSLLFAVIGFSYNAWRMEASEGNSNIRTAAFEMLNELAELEQIVYAAHYDHDPVAGNARRGWVKVGLIHDLALLVDPRVSARANQLKTIWAENWQHLETRQQASDHIVAAIDAVRQDIREVLASLK